MNGKALCVLFGYRASLMAISHFIALRASIPYKRIGDLSRNFSHKYFPFGDSPSVQGAPLQQASWSEYAIGNAENQGPE